jgi:hypothetical protein
LLLLACNAAGMVPGSGAEPGAVELSGSDWEATVTRIAADTLATQAAAMPEAVEDMPAREETPEPEATATTAPTETVAPTDTPTRTPLPSGTPTRAPTTTPRPTNTPQPDLVVKGTSINLRTGPGTNYPALRVVQSGETGSVLGQAYDCAWLLVSLADGQQGWITGGAEYITLNLACADISQAQIPPSPTPAFSPTPVPPPTQAATATAERPTVTVYVLNNTGGTLTLDLSGPATYHFTLAPGTHPIQVVPGTYSYTGTGCGGASKSGTMDLGEGDEWEWWCG